MIARRAAKSARTDPDDGLTVRFWGARGSYPTPGPSMARYGGNTACVEVRLGSRLFVIDAGSGLEGLGRALVGSAPARIDILLSHLHHDHVSALPFFAPALTGRSVLRLHCGNLDGESARAPLERMFSPPLFPMKLCDLPARFDHVGFRAGETLTFEDGVAIATAPLRHPCGATAYRFDHGGRRVCYLSDMEHEDCGPSALLTRYCEGADLVIYDAMFTDAQFGRFRGWGHSTWRAGVELCRAAGAKALAAFHHHTLHDDAALDAIDAELSAALPGSFVVRERQSVRFAPVKARVAESA